MPAGNMRTTATAALLVAAFAVLVSLVYTKLPGVSGVPAATSTPPSEAAATASLAAATEASTTTAAAAPEVRIGGRTVRVDVAATDEARELGLGGRNSLGKDEGMLFVFPADGVYPFWMKGVRFSIDIVWLSATGTIVDIAQNISPDTYPASFSPRAPARYVLELPAGFAKEYSVHIGDLVALSVH